MTINGILHSPSNYAILRSMQLSALPDENDAEEWRKDESLRLLGLFAADLCTETTTAGRTVKMRKCGRLKEETHYYETASNAVAANDRNKRFVNLPDEVIAFTAYAHDLCEDYESITPEIIAEKCWKGARQYAPVIIDALKRLTDDPALRLTNEEKKTLPKKYVANTERKRLNRQLRQANGDPTGLSALIRWSDKYSAYVRDYNNLLDRNEIPPPSLRRFKAGLSRRKMLIDKLAIPAPLKKEFGNLVELIEERLDICRKKGIVLRTPLPQKRNGGPAVSSPAP